MALTSGCKAWAVGSYNRVGPSGITQTLVLYWNGKRWEVQRSPSPGRSPHQAVLSGVAATSPTNAWAVGSDLGGCSAGGCASNRTLVEHWNGKAWKVQPSPSPGNPGFTRELSGVAATSTTNAWAVGGDYNGTLIEHWNGKAWKVQPSPNPSSNFLTAVAATSPTNAWAVGLAPGPHGHVDPLVEHWDGKAWQVQPSPRIRGGFDAVTATSPTNAWAVGGDP